MARPRLDSTAGRGPHSDPRERLLEVRARWGRSAYNMMRRGVLAGGEMQTVALVVAAMFVLVLALVDGALWNPARSPGRLWLPLPPPTGATLAAVAAVLLPVNALLVHLLVAWRTREEHPFRRWLLVLRFFAGAMPLLNLHVPPLWVRLGERRPGWALRESPPAAAPAPPGARRAWLPGAGLSARLVASRWAGGIDSPLVAVWLLAPNYLFALDAAGWAAARAAPDRLALALVSLPLHLLATASLLPYLQRSTAECRVGGRFPARPWLALFWLLPVPYLGFAGLLLIMQLRETAGAETLIHQALLRRQGTGRLPLWLGLEHALRRSWTSLPWWRRWRRPPGAVELNEVTVADRRVLRLYDAKALLLALDAISLAWWLSRLAAAHPGWQPFVEAAIRWSLYASLALCALGLLLGAGHLLAQVFRTPGRLRVLDEHPYARYLAAGQAAWGGGLFIGALFARGSVAEAGRLLAAVIALYGVVTGFSLMASAFLPGGRLKGRTLRDALGKLGRLLAFGLLAVGLLVTAQRAPALLGGWPAVSTLVGVLLARTLVPWFQRPLMPRGAISGALPRPLRYGLAFVRATVVLPLGGHFVPVWIGLRHRFARATPPAEARALNQSPALRV